MYQIIAKIRIGGDRGNKHRCFCSMHSSHIRHLCTYLCCAYRQIHIHETQRILKVILKTFSNQYALFSSCLHFDMKGDSRSRLYFSVSYILGLREH